jgi:hypothetical protein
MSKSFYKSSVSPEEKREKRKSGGSTADKLTNCKYPSVGKIHRDSKSRTPSPHKPSTSSDSSPRTNPSPRVPSKGSFTCSTKYGFTTTPLTHRIATTDSGLQGEVLYKKKREWKLCHVYLEDISQILDLRSSSASGKTKIILLNTSQVATKQHKGWYYMIFQDTVCTTPACTED